MKNVSFVFALAISAMLMVTTSGCKHGGVDPRKIPGKTIIPGQSDTAEAAPVQPITPTVEKTQPINPIPETTKVEPAAPPVDPNQPQGFTEGSIFDNINKGPHTTDRDIFSAYTVYFELDSAVIRSDEGPKLESIAKHFAGNTNMEALLVEGHCDERGTEQYNVALGDKRALAIREYLIRLGVEPGRIGTMSYGEAHPVDPGHNEAAWKKNRRGESVLLKATAK